MKATAEPTGTALVDGLRIQYADSGPGGPVILLTSNARYLAERVPGSELTVLTAGHFAWEQVPGQFASMVADWVTRAETGPSGTVS